MISLQEPETGFRVYGKSLYYLSNISVNLKRLQNKKCIIKNKKDLFSWLLDTSYCSLDYLVIFSQTPLPNPHLSLNSSIQLLNVRDFCLFQQLSDNTSDWIVKSNSLAYPVSSITNHFKDISHEAKAKERQVQGRQCSSPSVSLQHSS